MGSEGRPEDIDEEVRRILMRRMMQRLGGKKEEKGVINVKSVTEFDNYLKKATEEHRLVLVDFWAPWCMPCVIMAPVYEQVARKYSDKAYFLKVNVDEIPELAMRYQIMSIPTLIAFWRGEMLDLRIGAMPRHLLERWIQSLLHKIR